MLSIVGADQMPEPAGPQSGTPAVLVPRRASGGPQLSPVTFGLDGEGRVVVSTYPQRAKVANARRDPAVSLCVLSDEWDDPWVQLDG